MNSPRTTSAAYAEGTYMSNSKKKLIEVSLPLETINAEASREKSIRHGHPSTLHLYWSRKPTGTARAILFAQLVDDPSSNLDRFPTQEAQELERARLHNLIERLTVWESSNDEELMKEALSEILQSNNNVLPTILDPFAGGGSIPLEAQRLGLNARASDLNPLAVLLNKCMLEFVPKFADVSPVFPGADSTRHEWTRGEGLAADIRAYGTWMRDEAERRIGHLYPKVRTPQGTEHTVLAWKWARTVPSPNPANPIETPLVNSWWLSKRKGREAWVRAKMVGSHPVYEVVQNADGPDKPHDGTIGRKGGITIDDGSPFSLDYVRQQGRAGNIGQQLLAVIAEGERGRLYLSPSPEQLTAAQVVRPEIFPEGEIPYNPQYLLPPNYGYKNWSDLFTDRQLVAMTTLTSLVQETRERVLRDIDERTKTNSLSILGGGALAEEYADAISTYLGLAVSRMADYSSNLCGWHNTGEKMRNVFGRQAVQMTWDFAEANPFSNSSGNFRGQVEWVAKVVERLPSGKPGETEQVSAEHQDYRGTVISTDPPYYDYVGYADLSDFFYVWLRASLKDIQPSLFSTLLTPKSEELMANKYRQGGKEEARTHFVDGFNEVFTRVRVAAAAAAPMTVYYAYKQQDATTESATSNGWHTLLSGLISAGWEITATWPIRSEQTSRMHAQGKNTLASSIVLACRPRPDDAASITRRALVGLLKSELPGALRSLIQGEIAPVDLAQAAIGPGIAVFSRYSRVREADGTDMSVKDALLLINSTLDEVIGDQESDFDSDTRFAIKWYRQYGWEQENSGIADQLARSSDTSVGALERGGIFEAKGGKARLLSPTQLEGEWDAAADDRVSVWEATVRLAAVMAKDGADKVAELLPTVQTRVSLDAVKELGFLLFHEAEKKKDTKDAILFNGLVSSWGDLNEQARKFAESAPRAGSQQSFDFEDMES